MIAADRIKKKLLARDVFVEVEGESEPDFAQKHMQVLMDFGVFVRKFWGDGAFDDLGLFDFLARNGFEPAVKTRANAVPG